MHAEEANKEIGFALKQDKKQHFFRSCLGVNLPDLGRTEKFFVVVQFFTFPFFFFLPFLFLCFHELR